MKNMKIIVLVSALVFMSQLYAFAEGLDTLIEVARSQGEIAKDYKAETKAYESVKSAIDDNKIVKGMDKKAISDKYDEPVVVVGEYGTDRAKWIYMPSTSDFFKGPKISLFFTKDGILDEVLVEK